MQSLSPLQMNAMQSQQMTPMTQTSSVATSQPQPQSIPWGDLYGNLQTEFWNRLLRDPKTGDIATVRAKNLKPSPSLDLQRYSYNDNTEPLVGKPQERVKATSGNRIPITEYLRNMEKYQTTTPKFNENTSENMVFPTSLKEQRIRGQDPLVDYFSALLESNPNLPGFKYSFKGDDPWDKYGDNFLDYLSNKGVDLTSSRPWVKSSGGTDYQSSANKYLDDYLDKWVYNGSIRDEQGVNKFGSGAERLRWFGDDPNITTDLLRSDLRGASGGGASPYATLKGLVSPYADVNNDPAYKSWLNAQEQLRKGEHKAGVARIVTPVSMFASAFLPGIGTALGSALGLGSGLAGQIAGSALAGGAMGGLTSAAMGGDFGKGFLKGGLTGGVGAGLGSVFSGMNNFAAADAAQLAAQGLNPSQISQVLGQSGVGAGASSLYGNLASAGLTNPAWASGAANLISGGLKSAITGSKFDPKSSALNTAIGSQLPSSMNWATPYLTSAITGTNAPSPLQTISRLATRSSSNTRL